MSFKEFSEFNQTESPALPTTAATTSDAEMMSRVQSHIHGLLNPSLTLIFSKLLVIHLVVAAATLSVCPQFGFRLIGSGNGLYDVFMHLGHTACMILCGVFFLGTSFFVAPLFLTLDESRRLERHLPVPVAALLVMSLVTFMLLDTHMPFTQVGLWGLGAAMGAWLSLKAGRALRLSRQHF
jgi:hypothetical protein